MTEGEARAKDGRIAPEGVESVVSQLAAPFPLGLHVEVGPALTDDEWNALCEEVRVELSPNMRAQINCELWWCEWKKRSLETIPSIASVRRQLRVLKKAAETARDTLAYLRAAGVASSFKRPPGVPAAWAHLDASVWSALKGAPQSGWRRDAYQTQWATMGRVNGPDPTLQALEMLAFTTGEMLTQLSFHRGGRPGGGDKRFINWLLGCLRDSGIDIGYQHDRAAESGEHMQGVGWEVLIGVWSRRPDAFTVGEKSTLGTYYRWAHTAVA